MSHKDAPPETESQKACREWWEKARPTVKRAWGRAQDGSFLAEETRLIHQSWEAASQQANAEVERLRAEVERLRADLMESDEIREKLGHLLTRTAAALKGEPPAGVWHSWHDLPEKATQLAEALRELVEVFSESGMYDEEVFAKARAALAQQKGGA